MNKEYLDLSVNPGDNFFKFATGNWEKYNKQPEDKPSWGSFDVLAENTTVQLKELIESLKDEDDVMSKKIYDYYCIFTDYDKRNRDGVKPLMKYIDGIHNCQSVNELNKYATERLLINMFCHIGLGPDDKNSSHYEVHMSQYLLLNNREYYVSEDTKTRETLAKYKAVTKKVLIAAGYDECIADDMIDTYFSYEQKIAEIAYSYEKLDKPEENYNMMSVSEATEMFGFDINKLLLWNGYDKTDKLIVCQPEPLKVVFDILNEISLDDFKKCVEYHFIVESCTKLSEEFGDIMFEFKQYMTGAKKRTEKWKREVHAVDNMFYESLGKKYAEKYFAGNAKEKMMNMIKSIITAYSIIISEQKWMSKETKKYALEKLDAMTYKIGYPDEWKDFSDMPIDRNESLFENSMRVARYLLDRELEERYNKDIDPKEWPMMPQTVNACYMPTLNEICFPAAILQSPFFSSDATDAENYGGIGVVIGHEITHGFDTCGRLFDKDGNMRDWWTEEDSRKFKELVQNTKKHFDNLFVLPLLKCNGELTLNENIADYGGLKIAYRALDNVMSDVKREVNGMLAMKDENGQQMMNEKWVNEKYGLSKDEFSWEQLFFINYATVWAGVETEEIIRNSTLNNCHSVHYMRVNGTLPMFDKWYSAFGLNKDNCKMFVEKENRARVW